MQEENIIRKTKSVCPECMLDLDSIVVERQGGVFLEKECPSCGRFSLFLSGHPRYYRQLSDFYFSLISGGHKQRDYIVHLTNKCQLNCPICLADANTLKLDDYPLEKLKNFLRGKRGYKFDLMGAEPTLRDDLREFIRAIRDSGNICALHTNGIKIADFEYLRGLKDSGLNEVHLQFDGFNDAVYEKIRGRRLLALKEDALVNLQRLDIATDLVATIVRGVNEDQMHKIVEFASGHKFVKEVFFLGCRYLGKAKELPMERCYMPDELIDIFTNQTGGRVSRDDIFKFQKLYFSLLSAFSIRKCFYIQHYMLVRNKKGYLPVNSVFNLKSIQPLLEKYKRLKLKESVWALPYLIFSLFFKSIKSRRLWAIREAFCLGLPFIRGFDLGLLPGRSFLLGFISACDAYSFDYEVAKNCGKGAISSDLGIGDNGALDNVTRDLKAR